MFIIRWSLVRRFLHPPLKIQTDIAVSGFQPLSFKNRTDSVVRGSLRPFKKSDTAVHRSLNPLKIQTVLAVRRFKHLPFKNRTDSWIPASPFKIWTHSAVRRSLHPPLKFQTDLAVRGFHHLPKIEPIRLSMDPCIPFQNLGRFGCPQIPECLFLNLDRFGCP